MEPGALMPPAEAAALIRSGTREVGTLTYGWGSGADPDPDGAYLRSVQAALRTRLSQVLVRESESVLRIELPQLLVYKL